MYIVLETLLKKAQIIAYHNHDSGNYLAIAKKLLFELKLYQKTIDF